MAATVSSLKIRLQARTAFATPFQGDTLFGQLCWGLRHGWDEARLRELLTGYTAGQPFLVVSDAFPAGYLPLPALPSRYWAGEAADPSRRKELKRQIWLPESALALPMAGWQAVARQAKDIAATASRPQHRNSLDRLTQTTGKGDGFSPYSVRQWWYPEGSALEIHLRLDETRLSRGELEAALKAMGETGYGKDANVGLGKFTLEGPLVDAAMMTPGAADAWLTLAPSAPQGLGFDARRSYYRPFTRYGRHGDQAARLAHPFKSPLLLAATGALFAVPDETDWSRGFLGQGLGGQGLGGQGRLSTVLSETVHQGYAPAIGVKLP